MNEERLKKIVVYNAMMTRLNYSLVGASIWTLIGMMQVPIFATILKVSDMVSSVISGKMQQKFSHVDKYILAEINFKFELGSVMLYSLGNILIPFYFYIGISMMVLGAMLNGVGNATQTIQRDKLADMLYPDINDRANYRGHLKFRGAIAHTFGLLCNLGIMSITVMLGIDQMLVLKYIIFIHGILSIVDFLISLIEKKAVHEYYNTITA